LPVPHERPDAYEASIDIAPRLRYAPAEVVLMGNGTQVLVSMTEANRNFSKVVRLIDENGTAVILQNNKPRYMVLSFQEYDEIQTMRRKLFNTATDSVISENLVALRELAK
jgi:antitoxin Phd